MDASIDSGASNQQRQAPPFDDLDDAALEAAARDAQATAETLAIAAAEAERAATEAARVFEAEPTEKGALTKQVRNQRAANARRDADRARDGAAQLATAHDQRIKRRRIAEEAPIADLERLLTSAHARMRTRVVAMLASLADAGRELQTAVDRRNAAVAELTSLSASLGLPVASSSDTVLPIERVAEMLTRRLEEEFGRQRNQVLADGTFAGAEPAPFFLRACGRSIAAGEYILNAHVCARWSESQPQTTESAK